MKSMGMGWAKHAAHMSRSAYMVLVEKQEENRPLERPRLKWKYNIKMDIFTCSGCT
jgi:hypothetical protein